MSGEMQADMTENSSNTSEDDRPTTLSELRAEMKLLREENQRLREAYAHSRRSSHQRTAVGLLTVGIVAVGGAWAFPAVRQILLALAAIGIFGAILTYYLTPEGFIAASVGERVYAALAQSAGDLADELGLSAEQIYVPVDGSAPARLFIPQHEDDELPADDELNNVLVVGENETRGISLVPTGGYLFREFEQTLTEPFGETPQTAVRQLTDALVEEFELARGIDIDLVEASQQVTLRVSGSTYGQSERLDNPLASLVGVGLAQAVEAPVNVETAVDSEEVIIMCRWQTEEPVGSETDEEPDSAEEIQNEGEVREDASEDVDGQRESSSEEKPLVS